MVCNDHDPGMYNQGCGQSHDIYNNLLGGGGGGQWKEILIFLCCVEVKMVCNNLLVLDFCSRYPKESI